MSSFYTRQKENLAHKMHNLTNDPKMPLEDPTIVVHRPSPRTASMHPKELISTPIRAYPQNSTFRTPHASTSHNVTSPTYNIEQENLINRMRERLKTVEQKEQDLRDFSARLKERAQKVYAIEKSLKEKEAKVNDLRSEYEKMKITLNEHQMRNEKREIQMKDQEREIADERHRVAQDRVHLEEQKRRFAQLEQQRLEKLEEMQQREHSLSAEEKKASLMRLKVEEMESIIRERIDACEAKEQELEQVQRHVESDYKTIEKMRADLTEARSSLESQIKSLTDRNEQLRDELDQKARRVDVLDLQITEQCTQLDDTKEALQKARQEMEQLTVDFRIKESELMNQLREYKQRELQQMREREEQLKEIRARERALQAREEELLSTTEDLKQKRKDLEQRERELREKTLDVDTKQSEIENLEKELDARDTKLLGMEKELLEKEDQIMTRRKEFEDTEQRYMSETKRLKDETLQREEKIKLQAEELNALNEQLLNHKKALDQEFATSRGIITQNENMRLELERQKEMQHQQEKKLAEWQKRLQLREAFIEEKERVMDVDDLNLRRQQLDERAEKLREWSESLKSKERVLNQSFNGNTSYVEPIRESDSRTNGSKSRTRTNGNSSGVASALTTALREAASSIPRREFDTTTAPGSTWGNDDFLLFDPEEDNLMNGEKSRRITTTTTNSRNNTTLNTTQSDLLSKSITTHDIEQRKTQIKKLMESLRVTTSNTDLTKSQTESLRSIEKSIDLLEKELKHASHLDEWDDNFERCVNDVEALQQRLVDMARYQPKTTRTPSTRRENGGASKTPAARVPARSNDLENLFEIETFATSLSRKSTGAPTTKQNGTTKRSSTPVLTDDDVSPTPLVSLGNELTGGRTIEDILREFDHDDRIANDISLRDLDG